MESTIYKILVVYDIILQDLPIFSAVSSLSPVSIHIFIPAYYNELIVYGTSSYNLSSTAVAPSRTIFLSNLSYILSNSFSLFLRSFSASLH